MGRKSQLRVCLEDLQDEIDRLHEDSRKLQRRLHGLLDMVEDAIEAMGPVEDQLPESDEPDDESSAQVYPRRERAMANPDLDGEGD